MPANTSNKTRWEDQVSTIYLLDPATGEPIAVPISTILPRWHYIGSTAIMANGQQQVPIQAGATSFVIEARGGWIHYAINGVSCGTGDSYIAKDGMRSVGPMSNLTSLWVYGATVITFAHVQFWREA